MIKSFYSLSSVPFAKEMDTKHFFQSHSSQEGMARLEYLKGTRGIGVLTGEAGCGKTSLVRRFTDSLNISLFKVVYFPLSTVTVTDFYRGLAFGLGVEPKFRKVDLFAQIQRAILEFYYDRKMTPVLILDEMQMASNQFLNDISLLFNFKMDSQNPFVLILTGLPHFLDRLKLTHNQPLSQRIVMRYQVAPLSKEEVFAYVNHHLKLAGASYDIFTPGAIEALTARSRGCPRLINNLATHALIFGCSQKHQTIDEEVIFAAATEAGL